MEFAGRRPIRGCATLLHRAWAARLSIALVAYGAANVVLYAGLTPLWDGFDEPFHYGYVQYVARYGSLPVVGRAGLSAEIGQSLALAPASHLVKRNIPGVMTFDEYFRLPRRDRLALRGRLDRLESGRTQPDSGGGDYEALQAPLAYVFLAPFDRLFFWMHLPSRVLALRLVGGVCSVLMTAVFTLRLGGQLGLSALARSSVIFLVFSCQMFYASVAHIANDWLAIPLFVLVLSLSVSTYLCPGRSSVLALGLALAAGLLTKAYFLCAVPPASGVVLVLCLKRKLLLRHAMLFLLLCGGLAGPWYARNLVLYGSLTGMQESAGGTSLRQVFTAALRLPWARSVLTTARAALWTGNNSGTTFDVATIDLLLLLALAGACLYGTRALIQHPAAPGRTVITGLLCYSMGLAFSAALTFNFTHGAGIAPAPWYSQVLFPPGLCLLVAGFSIGGLAGRVLWAGTVWLWAYVISATYVAKLLPLYGGISAGPTRLAALARSYRDSLGQLYDNLGTVALMPAGLLLCLTALAVGGAACLAAWLSIRLLSARADEHGRHTALARL